jgi:hypothetical protein
MKKLGRVLVVAVMFAAGNALAETLPVTNGDFETAPTAGYDAFTSSVPGWDSWSPSGTPLYLIASRTCPDGGAYSLVFTDGTMNNVLEQTTSNVIESGNTYTLSADIYGGNISDSTEKWTSFNIVLYEVGVGAQTPLASFTVNRSDFTADAQWKTYSVSYVADATYAGANLDILIQELGGWAPAIDSVRLEVTIPPVRKTWQLTSPFAYNDSAYYGNVCNGKYTVGQIDRGCMQYDVAGLIYSMVSPSSLAKSVVQIGSVQYSAGSAGGLYATTNWDNATVVGPMAMTDGSNNLNPEAICTDGTYIYSNSYKGTGKGPVKKYQINSDNTLTTLWSATIPGATRLRGTSYFSGKVYVADETGGLWEINAADGSSVTNIATVSLGAGEAVYQAAREGNALYAVTSQGRLFYYKKTGETWSLTRTETLLNGAALYGIGLVGDGVHFWLSSANTVSYWQWTGVTALPGDANLDGVVSVSDLSVLAANYNTTSGATWDMGDFDSNGAVSVSDLSILAAHYNSGSSSTLSWADAYAQAFGTTSDTADETSDDATASSDDSEDTTSSVCSSLGLSLIAGLALLGLMIVKLEE